MDKREKKNLNMKVQWAKFTVVMVLYLLFLLWLQSWLGIIVIPFIYDAYISKKINWQWWKDAEAPVRAVMSWVDAIVFALVAVYFINQFFFQNYVIPSSSLEKSLLTGDYLFVSKVSYGPRIPQTPLTMPLTQHTLPVFETKSYIEWPHWDYRRVKGLGNIQLNDIVVFNYPAGDTILTNYETQYYDLIYSYGGMLVGRPDMLDSLPASDRRAYYDFVYGVGRRFVTDAHFRKQVCESSGLEYMDFGQVDTRPVDRRENYVKRCVGLPGQTLQIINREIYLDGQKNKQPDQVQFGYRVKLKRHFTDEELQELQITMDDLADLNQRGYMPLTNHAVAELKKRGDLCESVELNVDTNDTNLYPQNGNLHWTCDNYGPLWIPKKGESIDLTLDNLPIYERPIRIYEGNELEVRDDKIFINGQEAKSYTFKMDYYWMMGDNRHNSADSRYWGFVPEDHIVGKPIFVWWSSDPDRHGFSGIRWSRLFTFVDNIK